LRTTAPKGDYLHEIKYDGYRVQLHIDGDKSKAFTRNGLNWTKRFSVIAGAFEIPGQAIIDGEVVVVHEGRTNFSELQADLARGDLDRLLYFAFDLLWLGGQDLRKRPQVERKAMLQALFDTYKLDPPILYSEYHEGDGQEMSRPLSA
jgi:bifunctional non-homologous end joining protein LigD